MINILQTFLYISDNINRKTNIGSREESGIAGFLVFSQ